MVKQRLDAKILKGLGDKQEEISLWMVANKKGLFIGATLLLASLLILIFFLFPVKGNWSIARNEVENNLSKIEHLQVAGTDEMLYLSRSIESKFDVSSEFAPFYQGRLARALIQNGGVEEAKHLLDAQQNRLTLNLPSSFKLFSESSLLIAEGEFEKAWEKELLLQNELALEAEAHGNEHWIETLTAFNLVRRALLADLLEKMDEAKDLRTEILASLQQKDMSIKEPLEAIVEAYRIGQRNMLSYLESHVQEREQLANTETSSPL